MLMGLRIDLFDLRRGPFMKWEVQSRYVRNKSGGCADVQMG
jgi:hypothetical protein